MQKSKLFQLLSVVRQDEWSDLMYHIKTKRGVTPQVKQLGDFLYKRRKNLHSKVMDIDHVRVNYFDGMSRKNFQNMMSKICKLVEEYFVLHSVLNDEAELELRLFQELNERSLFDLANKSASKSIEKWKTDKSLNISVLLNILRIEHKQYFSNNPIKYDVEAQIVRRIQDSLMEISETYSPYYDLLKKMQIRRDQRMEMVFQNKRVISDTSKYLQKIIHHLNILYIEESQDSFNYLFDLLFTNQTLDKELRAVIFNHCQIFLYAQIRDNSIGESKDALLQLYDFGVEQEILVYNGALATVTFQNIIQMTCNLKEFEWANGFRSKNLVLIPVKERHGNMIISQVQIAFGLKEYEEVIQLLNTSDIDQFVLKILSRWLLLSSHFITHDSFEFFEAQVSSFTQFIYYNKNKMSQRNLNSSLNLAKIFKSYLSKPDFNLEEEANKYESIIFKNRLPEFFAERKRYVKENGLVV